MRPHALSIAILLSIHHAHASETEEIISLPLIQVNAEQLTLVDNVVKVENRNADNKTLGDALKHISGVQSSAFGPNAGAPVIRSLSGNRVQILEDGASIYGMNAISGDISIPFDPLFSQTIIVNKSSDSVRYGGNAIGGSVNIDTGLIDQHMPDKNANLEVVAKKGWNDFDAKGFKLNLNNQHNFSTNFLFSTQDISSYKIPGNSKASVCNTALFPASGGTNTALADACQKEARVQQVYNTASQPYIDQFMTENPDWADGTFSFYTDKPTSVWSGKTYINPENPDYVPDTPKYTQNKINRDVTPDYKNKLGNSYLENQHYAIGSTYLFDRGYIGISADSKKSEYGVPGFSLENKSFQANYDDGLPVGVKTDQRKYTLQSQLNFESPFLNQIQFNTNKLINTSGEYLGAEIANRYKFDTQQAELLLKHQPMKLLSGFIGLNYVDHKVKGQGELRYLPDLNTQTQAIFIKEKLDFNWLELDVGYRTERVEHKVQDSDFKTSRNSPNVELKDRKFNLDSFNVGSYLKFNDLIGLKLRYSVSERAPEINELYASNAHYSIMLQEEGNQNLKEEKSKNLELTGLIHYKDFDFEATVYKMKYDNYLYLTHSGLQTANRLPLKYWTQTDTEITGFEIDVKQKVDLNYYGNLVLSAFADLVKNKNLNPNEYSLFNDGNYLPNMPTNRYGANIEWEKNDWSARLSSIYYDKPQYLGKNVSQEIPLPAYNMVDLQIRKHLKLHNADFDVFLNGSNLLDEDARPQNSPLKYIAPLPGRGFQIGVSMKL
ncbi:TonB-dependent receptor [Acinetobacter puyangensis]|uniref:TonB-dependent receptor n=1 Tax=Acinetobacter puyangensis TaxID=1096779 RepID=UPI003A4DEAF7